MNYISGLGVAIFPFFRSFIAAPARQSVFPIDTEEKLGLKLLNCNIKQQRTHEFMEISIFITPDWHI